MQHLKLLMIVMGVTLHPHDCFSRTMKKAKLAATNGDMRIVNGRDTEVNEFPYQVLLGVMEGEELVQECGGSILDERHVLTAAHCVHQYRSRPEKVRVMVGDIAQHGTSRYRQIKSIEQIYIHEEYNDNNEIIPFDIALLRTKGRFRMNKGVKPIGIPRKRITEGLCVVTGWGAMSDDKKSHYPENLQAVNVPLIDMIECKRLSSTNSGEKIGPGVICAGYREGGQDSCDGDSGGPLVCQNVQVGIASWGEDCGEPGQPGYYTEVFYYQDWIENKLEESMEDNDKRRKRSNNQGI